MAVTGNADANHFDPAAFDAAIEQNGAPALWRRAQLCPCMHPERGQPGINCPHCSLFRGRVYDAGASIKVLAPGRQRRDRYEDVGSWEEGFLTLTFPTSVTPGHHDLVVLQVGEVACNGEWFKRGEVDSAGRSRERVRMDPISAETAVAIVGANTVTYRPTVDFDLQPDGDIVWRSGRGPATGGLYSLRYIARPTFLIWSPMSRDEGGVRMPYRCQAQRLDFFDRRSVDG